MQPSCTDTLTSRGKGRKGGPRNFLAVTLHFRQGLDALKILNSLYPTPSRGRDADQRSKISPSQWHPQPRRSSRGGVRSAQNYPELRQCFTGEGSVLRPLSMLSVARQHQGIPGSVCSIHHFMSRRLSACLPTMSDRNVIFVDLNLKQKPPKMNKLLPLRTVRSTISLAELGLACGNWEESSSLTCVEGGSCCSLLFIPLCSHTQEHQFMTRILGACV